MESNQISKQKAESQPIIYRLRHYLFSEHDYRINIVSNQLERKQRKADKWELVNINDIDVEMYDYGLKSFKDPLRAIFGSKVIPKYDPFIEYCQSLPAWDSTQPDYIEQLASYVKTEENVWWQAMFKKWMVRYVGQTVGKIPFNKQCLTLVSPQNDGKTTFLDFLVPFTLRNYSKKGFDFGSKEGKFSLVQNCLINLDELASFEKKELNNEFKTVLSEGTVKFRPLFLNIEVPFPRKASFVASTNMYEFLTDETGNVRWLPFVVTAINHDDGGPKGYKANVDIDKVWAQAYSLLNDPSFNPNMTKEEIVTQELYNRRFLKTSTEMEVISKYFESSSKADENALFYTASDIEEYLRTKVMLKLQRIQIGKALQIMGFVQTSSYNSKKRYSEKGYFIRPK